MWDLEQIPWPLESRAYDEVHAYHVIEHCTGRQGDAEPFFAFFTEVHRVLKPGGLFIASVPLWNDEWAWADPSHKRVITQGTLSFLLQEEYEKQIGKTHMSDYRYCYKVDFALLQCQRRAQEFCFVLKAA